MSILAAVIGSIQGSVTLTPSYTLTPFFSGGPESVNEGSGLNFTVGGTNIPDGTYYWTIETNAGDFATASGTVSVTSNSGTFTVTPTADTTTEGAETFTVALRSVSITGTILVTSSSVTINDTSFAIGGQYVFNGTPNSWATTNATVTTYGAYTYPDETSGSLHTLTGSQYLMSSNIGNNTVLNINLWFYPTANNKIIMGETGQPVENGTWHYSMLDIDNTNHLKGRLWEFVGVTSTGTVTLNAWNHAYLFYNSVTGNVGMSLNNETAVTTNTGSRHPSDTTETYLGIGVLDSQNMSSYARYQGKFADLVIDTTLTGSNYTATKAKYLPPLSLAFGGDASPDYLSVPASADWALGTSWTIEWWSKATTRTIDGGAGLWTVMCQNTTSGAIDIYYQDSKLKINNGTVLATEPVPGQWTHVALVNNAGTTTLYYNGTSVYSGGNWNLSNTTDPLVIGRRGSGDYQYFPGFLSMIRISDMAMYTGAFTPTITYGNEVSTVLFLGLTTPLTDISANAHPITNNSVTTTINVPSTISAQSLEFNNPQVDYLVAPASADWNLGNDWTIEFWIRSNNNSASNINIPGGQWALLNQGGWYGAMPDNNCILVSLTGGYFTINQSASSDISFVEPTTQQWTHVAIVNNGGGSAQKVYYNGVEQTPTGSNYTTNGKTNTTEPLYIGRLKPDSGGLFDGKMAMIRISNTAKYLTAFTATTTYGIEADTKLFLGKYAPWTDNTGLRAISNIGVSTASSFPQTLTGIIHPFTGGTFGITYCVFGDPNITAFSAIPVGARITSNIPGFGIRTATTSTADGSGWRVIYSSAGLTGTTSTSDVFNFYW